MTIVFPDHIAHRHSPVVMTCKIPQVDSQRQVVFLSPSIPLLSTLTPTLNTPSVPKRAEGLKAQKVVGVGRVAIETVARPKIQSKYSMQRDKTWQLSPCKEGKK